MSMTADLRDLLKDAGVAGGRVYRDLRPAIAGLPAVTLQTISEPINPLMKGEDALRETRVQVNCYADSRQGADDLRDAVLAARPTRSVSGGTNFRRITAEGGRSGSDTADAGLITYWTMIDLMIWHRPAS